jgi:Zn-dependent protease with chaperone function
MSVDEDLNGLGIVGSGSPSMPGRVRWMAWYWGAFTVSAAVIAIAGLARPGAAATLVIYLVAQLVVYGIGPIARLLRLRRLLGDRRYRTVPVGTISTAVLAAVAPSGVHDLTLRVGPAGGFARSFRAGHRAVFLVHERVHLRPEAARFLIAHESAHLARYDQIRRPAVLMTVLICWLSVAVIWLPGAAIGVVAAVAALSVYNRAMELDCDRLAVRWTGPAPAEQAISLIEAANRHAPPKALRRVRSLLTYPSPRRRLAACRAVRP